MAAVDKASRVSIPPSHHRQHRHSHARVACCPPVCLPFELEEPHLDHIRSSRTPQRGRHRVVGGWHAQPSPPALQPSSARMEPPRPPWSQDKPRRMQRCWGRHSVCLGVTSFTVGTASPAQPSRDNPSPGFGGGMAPYSKPERFVVRSVDVANADPVVLGAVHLPPSPSLFPFPPFNLP